MIAPEDDLLRMSVESLSGDLSLIDGRYQFNNGWFVVRSVVAPGRTKEAVKWIITPHVIAGWRSDPVIHVSQVGYHPLQKKSAIIELDRHDTSRTMAELIRIGDDGSERQVIAARPDEWGKFLRYTYLAFDFSKATDPGMYKVKYGTWQSQLFRIDADVYQHDVWQPTLEYFLPVQMCHMRVNEKYRVWHGLCHMDDAEMAPVSHTHFDGYAQGPSTLTAFSPGDHVPGLNSGGWHDAGDYDLRVESQSGEVYILTEIMEAFHPHDDETTVDQDTRVVEIHQPDGKEDILQQIEHGALSVVGGYQHLGRLYRGIICPSLRQYVLLGDGVNMTDGQVHRPQANGGTETPGYSAIPDDRLVFTEDNPARELTTASHLAAASRVLKGYNDTLSAQCLSVAETLFALHPQPEGRAAGAKILAATELLRTTGKDLYRNYITSHEGFIAENFNTLGWLIGPALPVIGDAAFSGTMRAAASEYSPRLQKEAGETPFGVPYRPKIWGAGWDIQNFGVRAYYLHQAFPEQFPADYVFNALNFVLGVHPGSNTSSFASGIGTRSTTVAYGINRADWSYIPGGVVSGTALIRPDFPELLDWPYLWQQQEYVMGGGATNFMFLVLAADKLTGR